MDEFKIIVETAINSKEELQSIIDLKKDWNGVIYNANKEESIHDPSTDISPDDSQLWTNLLLAAKSTNTELLARLLYLRGVGCRLVPDVKTGYRIIPIIDKHGQTGWSSQTVYDSEKWCLNPYKEKLIELIKRHMPREFKKVALPLQ